MISNVLYAVGCSFAVCGIAVVFLAANDVPPVFVFAVLAGIAGAFMLSGAMVEYSHSGDDKRGTRGAR